MTTHIATIAQQTNGRYSPKASEGFAADANMHQTPPPSSQAWPESDARAQHNSSQTKTDDKKGRASASEIADAEAILRVIESQLMDLQLMLENVPPDERGDILAQISNLSAAQSSLSSAIKGGTSAGVAQALSAVGLKATVNEGHDEVNDVESFNGDEITDFLADREVDGIVDAIAPSYMRRHNISGYKDLPDSGQTHVAQSMATMLQTSPELQGLLAMEAMIAQNPKLLEKLHCRDEACEKALALFEEAAQAYGSPQLMALSQALHNTHEIDGLAHSWLPKLLEDFKNENVSLEQFVQSAAEFLDYENATLNKLTQRSFNALNDKDKATLTQFLGPDVSGSDMHAYLNECKSRNLLSSEYVHQAYENVARFGDNAPAQDQLISAIATLNYNVELNQSLLQLQMTYANLPDSDKKDFVDELTKLQKDDPVAFQQQISAIIDGNNGMSSEESAIAEDLTRDLSPQQLEQFLNALLIHGNVEAAKEALVEGVIDKGEQFTSLAQEFHHEADARGAKMEDEEVSFTVTEVMPDGRVVQRQQTTTMSMT